MYKIVIVDDEPIQCKGLKNILNKMYDFLEIQVFVEAEAALKYIVDFFMVQDRNKHLDPTKR